MASLCSYFKKGNQQIFFLNFIKKLQKKFQSKCLEELEARNTILSESSMAVLGRSLKFDSQLYVLKLENCNLSDRTLTSLGNYL